MSEGWISLHRSIQEHWLWKDTPFSEGQAWIDLLLIANHEDVKTSYRGEIIVCERGTVNRSILSLSDRWKWSRKKTTSFLRLLEKDGMVALEVTTNRTTITIVNYGLYQDVGTTKGTTKVTTRVTTKEQRRNTNNKDNNENNEINNIGSPVFIELPLNDGTMHKVSEDKVAEYKSLYPSVDVEQELRNMRGWCDSNRNKRKTKSGVERFITSWLAREQNKPHKVVTTKGNSFTQIERQSYDMDALEKMLEGN